jgi:hypothetical protein
MKSQVQCLAPEIFEGRCSERLPISRTSKLEEQKSQSSTQQHLDTQLWAHTVDSSCWFQGEVRGGTGIPQVDGDQAVMSTAISHHARPLSFRAFTMNPHCNGAIREYPFDLGGAVGDELVGTQLSSNIDICHRPATHVECAEKNLPASTSLHMPSLAAQSATRRSSSALEKRKLESDEMYDTYSDTINSKAQPKRKRTRRNKNTAMLACPYFKRDPSRCPSRACYGPGWPTIHRVK